MNQQSRNFVVTPTAVAKLLTLRERYKKPLRFRIYIDDQQEFNLRIHDRQYNEDWTIEINGIGISFCKNTMSHPCLLVLDCKITVDNESGFEFVLQTDENTFVILDGDQAIARVISEEVEVCDAYGEYCYSTYS